MRAVLLVGLWFAWCLFSGWLLDRLVDVSVWTSLALVVLNVSIYWLLVRPFVEPRRPPRYIVRRGLAVETDDPMAAEVISRAFASRRPVIGTRNPDGTVEVKDLDTRPGGPLYRPQDEGE
jgi:hypothetical protein